MTDEDDRHAHNRAASRRDVMIGGMATASALAMLPDTAIAAGSNDASLPGERAS